MPNRQSNLGTLTLRGAKRAFILFTGFAIAACSGPNHLGNPLTLPIRAITSAADNAAYNRQRASVKEWITTNEVAMRAEGFSGPVTESLLATLPNEARAQVRQDLIEAAAFPDFTERATVVVMVLRV